MTAQSCSQKYKSDSLETSRMHWILMSICHSIIFSRADKTDGYAYLRANRATLPMLEAAGYTDLEIAHIVMSWAAADATKAERKATKAA